MPRFGINRLYMASDYSHTHLIRLQSTIHGEVSRLPLLWIGNRTWIRLKSNYEDSVGNLPRRSFTYKRNTDTLNIGPPPQSWSIVRCTAHGPSFARVQYRLYIEVQVSTLFTQPRAEGPRLCKSHRDRTEVHNGLVHVPWATCTWPWQRFLMVATIALGIKVSSSSTPYPATQQNTIIFESSWLWKPSSIQYAYRQLMAKHSRRLRCFEYLFCWLVQY